MLSPRKSWRQQQLSYSFSLPYSSGLLSHHDQRLQHHEIKVWIHLVQNETWRLERWRIFFFPLSLQQQMTRSSHSPFRLDWYPIRHPSFIISRTGFFSGLSVKLATCFSGRFSLSLARRTKEGNDVGGLIFLSCDKGVIYYFTFSALALEGELISGKGTDSKRIIFQVYKISIPAVSFMGDFLFFGS